jgi:hypothetical protein
LWKTGAGAWPTFSHLRLGALDRQHCNLASDADLSKAVRRWHAGLISKLHQQSLIRSGKIVGQKILLQQRRKRHLRRRCAPALTGTEKTEHR